MNDDNKNFKVLQVIDWNCDVGDVCRTLKSQYYKNSIKNLCECGEHGGKYCCTGAIAYVEYEDDLC